MDCATEEDDFRDESRLAKNLNYGRSRWKQRRGFLRKNRRPSRPETYIGQRNNRRVKCL
jgi:hypothetical protein